MIARFLFWIDVKVFWLVTLGTSKPDETISAASWSLKLDGKWQGGVAVPVIDVLARLVGDGRDHCQRAYDWQIVLYKE